MFTRRKEENKEIDILYDDGESLNESEEISKKKNDLNDLKTLGMFEDVFFPDNKNREKRVNKLKNDIRMFLVELAGKKEKLDSFFTILQETLNRIAVDVDFSELKEQVEKPFYNDHSVLFSKILIFILDFTVAYKAVFGFTTSVVIGLAVSLLANAVFDAINGVIKKDRMQDVIQECLNPCVELYRDMMHLDLIIDKVQGFLNRLEYVHLNELSKEKIQDIYGSFRENCRENIREIEWKKAEKALEKIDKQRGS
ncbi:22460_t:CDS:2 [Dentiscutata erythropus]|uniref:22460_t:CDS:1 n=1 Tax=Dentiscutata erythropus TaxID=1348616 RepID=A0A9N9J257_9GLOM|nr:22460_t:CDS:2 [Dentiscutata erythropus]